MAKKKKKKKSNVVLNIIIALVFLAGAGVFLYPTISDMWNQYRNAQLVSKYEEAVTELSDNDYDRLWKEAKEYNAEHPVNAIVDAFEEEDTYELSHPYDRVLDPNGDGLMGSIEIPKIKARLAIYHGLSKTVLEKGVGHVEGTSLPIGGKSTHAVLAAHRGLPNAKLFTDLDQMEKGDIFILHILGKHLAYKVDQIKTVLPNETSDLDIIEGEDHVTLITCTPYGVNTHRLLVRGVRTKYVVEDTKNDETILAAHRGLPNAKLFTDLDQMEKGDIFILHILGKHLAYKVDQIKTVLPNETSDLDIIEGEDHVTLITCTPYGVNTHRLLVRGVRTKYVVEDTKNDETIPQKLAVVDPKRVLAGGAAVLVVLILLIYLIVRHRDKKRKKKQLSERKEEAESDEK